MFAICYLALTLATIAMLALLPAGKRKTVLVFSALFFGLIGPSSLGMLQLAYPTEQSRR